MSNEDQYLLYQQLAKEYEIFRCDTAIYYANGRLALAEEIGNIHWIQESKFQVATVLAKACMFEKAISLLQTVDKSSLTPQQLFFIIKTFRDTYIYYSEFYQEGYEMNDISRLRAFTRIPYSWCLPMHSFDHVIPLGTHYIEVNELKRI